MINKAQVEHIAKLARIKLTDKEVEKFRKDLSSILDYFEILKKADVSKIGLSFYPTERFLENKLREDEKKPEIAEMTNEIVEAAPDKKTRHIKVKTVF